VDIDDAYIIAQKEGKSPALCAVNSSFATAVQSCQTCVIVNGDINTTTLQSYVEPELQPFLDFCAAAVASEALTGASSTAVLAQASQISSQLSQASLISSIKAEASSLGLFNESIAQVTSTILYTQTATPSQYLSGNSTSTSKISTLHETPLLKS
jgi:hypothetical protein